MNTDLSEELNIGKLFNEFSFRVPIYQRNYAWGEEEITQLLRDINDIGDEQNYYLGTLVLFKKGEHHDVIDGQQRLTTLYLLHKVLSVKAKDVKAPTKRLAFESRPKTIEFFKTLAEKNSKEALENLCVEAKDLDNFVVAINAINKFFDQDLKVDIEPFKNKCLNHTYLFTTVLPASTDVNHYFEIMNNRGEQLEKHEILKAKFLNELVEGYNKEKFAAIWEACSQMDNHVQYYVSTTNDYRKILFGDNYNTFPENKTIDDFLKVEHDNLEKAKEKESNHKKHDGFNILKDHKLKSDFNQEDKSHANEKFKSIIDFENFLLQVLSLIDGYENTNLEDKNLLKNFGYKKDSNIDFPDPKKFIKKLLQVRFLFDEYVVKREINENQENDWNWTIRSFKYDKNSSFVQNYTFGLDNYSKQLTQLQSMFQVSYSPNVNKTWLRDLLSHLCTEINIEAQLIYNFMMDDMRNRFNSSGFSPNQGLQTPRAVFNFLDYLLWEEYYNQVRGKDNIKDLHIETSEKDYLKNIFDLKDNFNKFRFTQRNSIEHFFPQSKTQDLTTKNVNETSENKVGIMNSFGNLCLISSSSNSSYNKEHPSFKKSKGRSKNESLKQQLMFQSMNGDSWGQKEIESHQKEMMELLNPKLGVICKNNEDAI